MAILARASATSTSKRSCKTRALCKRLTTGHAANDIMWKRNGARAWMAKTRHLRRLGTKQRYACMMGARRTRAVRHERCPSPANASAVWASSGRVRPHKARSWTGIGATGAFRSGGAGFRGPERVQPTGRWATPLPTSEPLSRHPCSSPYRPPRADPLHATELALLVRRGLNITRAHKFRGTGLLYLLRLLLGWLLDAARAAASALMVPPRSRALFDRILPGRHCGLSWCTWCADT